MPSRLLRGGFAFLDRAIRAECTSLVNSAGTESPCFPPQIEVGSISVHVPTVGEWGALDRTSTDFQRENWCCQTGLNCRPLHYQWSALPLSYGSVPRTKDSAKKAATRRPILATRPPRAQAQAPHAGLRSHQKRPEISVKRPRLPLAGQAAGLSGSPFPHRAPPAP